MTAPEIVAVVNKLIRRVEANEAADDETPLICAPTINALLEMSCQKRHRSDSIDSMETNEPTPKRHRVLL